MQVVSLALLLVAVLHSIEAVAWSRVAQACITTPVHLLAVKRVAGFSTRALMRAVAPNVLVLVWLVAWAVGFSFWRTAPTWSVLAVGGFGGGLIVIYAAALIAGRHPLAAEAHKLFAQLLRIRHRPA